MNLLDNKSFYTLVIPIIILIFYYFFHLFALVPFWPFDPDTFTRINFVRESMSVDMHRHHHMRWGSYLPIKLVYYIWDINFITLTLTSFVFFTSASIIFLFIVHKNFGLFYSIIFLLFWLTSKSLNLELFTLSVVNQSLLPLSLILLLLSKIELYQKSTLYLIILSFCIFWAYGCKETNLFFFPLIFFLKTIRENKTILFKILLFGLLFYILETLLFYIFSDQKLLLGRMFALLTLGDSHLQVMKGGFGLEHFSNLSKFESYFIPFYRWYSARDWDTTIFYITFILSIMYLFNLKKDNLFLQIKSNLIISFFIFNTFFLVSLFPPLLGQPFGTRYLTLLLPFSFIILIAFIKEIIDSSVKKIITIILLLIVLFTFFSRPVYSLLRIDEDWNYLSLLSNYKNDPWTRSNEYKKLVKNINKYDCVIIDSSNPVVEHILGVADYLSNSELNKNEWKYNNSIYKKIEDKKCEKSITVKENGIVF
mgnify:CR=1 FL=1